MSEVPGMAQAVKDRMEELGLGPVELQKASGLSGPQCLAVREGRRKKYQHKTLRGIAVGLRWPLDWYDRIIEGETKLPTVDHPVSEDVGDRVAALETQMGELRSAVDRVLALVDPPES